MTPLVPTNYKDRDALIRINGMPEPRHLFVLPTWLDSGTLDRLIDLGYVTCTHSQRNPSGRIQVAMGLQLTAKGRRMTKPEDNWQQLLLKGSLAGASLTVMSLLILYLG